MSTMQPIQIIGIGDDGIASLSPTSLSYIENADILVGGERHLSFFPGFTGEKWPIQGGLPQLVDRLTMERATKNIVVLASGDPLFYGIGAYLTSKLEGIQIHPFLSSVQLAFAAIGVGWQDADIISLHGKSIRGLAQKVDGRSKVALLTDDLNTPQAIAKYLLDYDITEYDLVVAENLGSQSQRIGRYGLSELLDIEFSPLNVVILIKQKGKNSPSWSLGIDDDQFAQRKPDKGLITKREVRVLSLSEMNLKVDSIVWDIGTCTGSMAIEAAKMAPQGQVFGIEKNEGDLENAHQNARKFRTDITFVHGKAPEGLDGWPDPDAVFVGGSGGEMAELLQLCANRLRVGGRIVLNAATIETLYEATQTFSKLGLATRITLVQTARSKPILHMTRFEGLNPIYIITAWKEEDLI